MLPSSWLLIALVFGVACAMLGAIGWELAYNLFGVFKRDRDGDARPKLTAEARARVLRIADTLDWVSDERLPIHMRLTLHGPRADAKFLRELVERRERRT